MLLTDKDREITFMQVQEETVFVEPAHLLACEEGARRRATCRLGDAPDELEFLALEGPRDGGALGGEQAAAPDRHSGPSRVRPRHP